MQQVWSDMWGKRWYDRLTAAITTTQWHRQTDRQTDKQTDALCVLSDTLVLSCCPWNVAYFPACQTTPRLHHSRSKSYTQTAHVTYTLNDKNTVSTVSWRRRPAVPVQVHALWRTAYWTTAVSFKSPCCWRSPETTFNSVAQSYRVCDDYLSVRWRTLVKRIRSFEYYMNGHKLDSVTAEKVGLVTTWKHHSSVYKHIKMRTSYWES